jgi:hypothetical protein
MPEKEGGGRGKSEKKEEDKDEDVGKSEPSGSHQDREKIIHTLSC